MRSILGCSYTGTPSTYHSTLCTMQNTCDWERQTVMRKYYAQFLIFKIKKSNQSIISSDKTLSQHNPNRLTSEVLQNCKWEQYLTPSFYTGNVLLQATHTKLPILCWKCTWHVCPWHIYLNHLSYMKYFIDDDDDDGSLMMAVFIQPCFHHNTVF